MTNIPNILSFLRLILVPFFVVVFYLPIEQQLKNFIVTAIFSLASITDFLDGYLARKLKQTSKFGAFIDPVADKIIVSVALILIVEMFNSPWISIPAILIISREIIVSALREWMAQIGKRDNVAVSTIGKYKTGFQITAIICLLWNFAPWVYTLGIITLYLATFLTLYSMIKYIKATIKST